MSDLVGNPEDQFSRVAAHIESTTDLLRLISLLFVKIISSNFREILRETWSFTYYQNLNFKVLAI